MSDPSADATSTQTWAAIEDTGSWPAPAALRDGRTAAPERRRPGQPGIPADRRRGRHGIPPAAAGAGATGAAGVVGAAGVGGGHPARHGGPAERMDGDRSVGPGSPPDDGQGGRSGRRARGVPPDDAPPGRATRHGVGAPVPRDLAEPQRPGATRDDGTGTPGDEPAGDRTGTRAGRRREADAAGAGAGGAPGSAAGGQAHGGRARRRRGSPAKAGRSSRLLAGLLALPVAVVIVAVTAYVYLNRGTSTPQRLAAQAPTVPASGASASLGRWRDITARSDDPVPLTLTELFPAHFTANGTGGARAVTRAGTKCARAVVGSGLRAAVRKAGCTQIMRASYLSSDRKYMATIGVLNLVNVTAAQKAGKAAGAHQFISQLPAAHGPTRNLTTGAGLELAEVKGHYLILIWAELTNLHSPSRAAQRSQLENFSKALIAGTVNVSLTSRMVTGKPRIP